jgi:beta-glucosidase-like glycosyl hydrolase
MSEGLARRAAELVIPALRWNEAERAYGCEGATLDEALDAGVGGFCFFGGVADDAKALIAELNARSRVPLLIASDLERGAGQQFDGLTGLPPLAALASLNDEDAIRRAARLTAREARSIGVNWIFAPVLDLDIEPDNPIVGTRALGGDPATVARLGTAWIEGCQAERVMACGKHFPGHGRTTVDSHAALPEVDATKQELLAADLVPFRAAIDAGVAGMMSAHISFPALDDSRVPATLSRTILRGLLRDEMRYDGLTVSDAMIMSGLAEGRDESDTATRALAAGVDLLLYPQNLGATISGIEGALAGGQLAADAFRQSLERRVRWAAWTMTGAAVAPVDEDRAWARDVAERVVHVVRGSRPSARGESVDVLIIDDDMGGPYPPPSREPFVQALNAAGVTARRVDQPGSAPLLIALFGDIRSWKGRPGYSVSTREAVQRATRAVPEARVIQFSHPRLATAFEAANVVCAWGGERPMQEAAARRLARSRDLDRNTPPDRKD